VRPSRPSELAAWFAALLLPTLFVKHRFMQVLSRWWVEGASTDALSDGEITSWARLWFGQVAPPDIIEVAVIVLALWLIGHRLLRMPIAWLATASVAAAVVFLGMTLLSLRETGGLLTVQATEMTLRWAARDIGVLAVTGRQLLLALGALLWIATPIVFARMLAVLEGTRPRLRFLAPGAAIGIVTVAAILRPDVFMFPGTVNLSRGLWSSALVTLAREAGDAPAATAGSARELLERYRTLVYPAGRPQPQTLLVDVPRAERRPRHVVFVILETAPRELYGLLDNATLPTFAAMSRHAITSDRHYASAPRTDLAVYSILSGTYPRGGAPIYEFGRFATDGLASQLIPRGYETTFVESTTVKWNVREEAVAIADLGFARLIEEGDAPLPAVPDPFDAAVARDRASLGIARDAIVAAEQGGKKALVAVATNLGHFPWRAPAGHESDDSAAKIAALARAVDGLMGGFLDALAAERLSDEVILVVVGDHGLRFSLEFDTFGVPIRHGDQMFNVPLLIHAPALIPHEVRLPWVTSHVDLEPTLLDLLGVPRDGLLLHGENMLDGRLADRVTFLPSGMFAPMYPVDGLHYRGAFYTWAFALDRVRARPASPIAAPSLSDGHVRDLLIAGRRLFDDTSARFLAARRTP
jgi:hypothetical protein